MLTSSVIVHDFKNNILSLQTKSFSNIVNQNEEIVYICPVIDAIHERYR